MKNDEYLSYFQTHKEEIIKEWKEYLKFASVSSLSRYKPDCLNCANWLVKFLNKAGFNACILDDYIKHIPPVFASAKGTSAYTALLYGHFDVQPPGDLDLWRTPPFEPTEKQGRIYARGARDNKGQNFLWLIAMRYLIEQNKPRPQFKVLLDGEEEIGSHTIFKQMQEWEDILQSNLLIASETPGFDNGDPGIILGFRGASYIRLKLYGAKRELHSGNHGGRVINPAEELIRAVGLLFNQDGTIALKEFYEDIVERSSYEKKLIEQIQFNLAQYKETIGVTALKNEGKESPLEQVFFMPSLTINGIHSGVSGSAVKTSIPTEAEIIITMRLVPNQNVKKITDALIKHIQDNIHPSCKLELKGREDFAPAFRAEPTWQESQLAQKVLKDISKRNCYFTWSGATIPIVPRLVSITGAKTLLIGFGVPEDNEHGINESFAIDQLEKGFVFACRYLESLSNNY